jgi:hypothetical protein
LLTARWSIPPALAERLKAAGREVPPSVDGVMLLDTGASSTCMALDVARALDLKPIRKGKTYGVGGLHELDVYRAEIRMEFHMPSAGARLVGATVDALGVPDLGKNLDCRVAETGLEVRLVGLLGREFLRHGMLFYGGSEGIVELWIDLETLRRPQ